VRHAHCNYLRTLGRLRNMNWLIEPWSETSRVPRTAAALQKTANGLNIAGIADTTAQVRASSSGAPCRHSPARALHTRSHVR